MRPNQSLDAPTLAMPDRCEVESAKRFRRRRVGVRETGDPLASVPAECTINPFDVCVCPLRRLQRAEKPLVKAASRVSESDFVVLEDENSRVHLVGDALHVNQLSTGVVCGVLGQAQENGDFQVYTRNVQLQPNHSLSLSAPCTPLRAWCLVLRSLRGLVLRGLVLRSLPSRGSSSHAGEPAVLSRSERAAGSPTAASGRTPAHAGAGVGTQGTLLAAPIPLPPTASDCTTAHASTYYASSTLRSSSWLHLLSTTDGFALRHTRGRTYSAGGQWCRPVAHATLLRSLGRAVRRRRGAGRVRGGGAPGHRRRVHTSAAAARRPCRQEGGFFPMHAYP